MEWFGAGRQNRTELASVFLFLDANGDGVLTRSEITKGVELLNSRLPPGQKMDASPPLRILDLDGENDEISVNDFVACWTIGSAHGSIDHV
ncbi:hypothetical protein T484DRAFT_1788181 [Baffinella frigidus]|nr:hypothetical protein T484DRAFT_1788181 [Cryptophyta sp. CCMP2293]